MFVGFVTICVALLVTSMALAEDPQCSKYDYEEKLLSKVIRMEIRIEELERQVAVSDAERMNDTIRIEELDRLIAASDAERMNGKIQSSDSGSTYVRWGRTTCDGIETELVYKGFAGGSSYEHQGAAINYLCLPEDPEWSVYNDALSPKGARMYGSEYQLSDSPSTLFKDQRIAKSYTIEASCAVCRTPRSAVLMIPAKKTCHPGWTREYGGYLAGGHHGHAAGSEYVCLDEEPEAVPGDAGNNVGVLFYVAEAVCGSLRCPPYVNGRELACVVCSK